MPVIMPIMVNTKTIGALTIARKELLRDGGEHEYEWELCMKDTADRRGTRRPRVESGTVTHAYDDGAVELLKKVVAQIP